MEFETVARTHVGCRRRVNEDAVLARPDLGLWAVADGMGGHEAGDLASALVVDALAAVSAALPLSDRAADAVARLAGANARLVALAGGGPDARTIGSTVAAVLVEAGGYVCLWAGDSRAYLCRGGALTQLTHDHSLVQELVDLGEIAPDDAPGHPNANVITRAVGVAQRLELDAAQGEAKPGDVFVLASDGVTRLVGEAEIAARVRPGRLEAAADELVALCLERGAPDNLSIVLAALPPA
jgi:serine/threonine protein phosphatase PrpC